MPIRFRVGAPEGLYRIRPFEMVVLAHPPERPGEFQDVADLWTLGNEEFGSRGRIDTTMGVGMVLIAPDGQGYLYSYRRTLSDLYVVEGLS